MPLSRFIRDLDDLLDAFNSGRALSAGDLESLRVAVTRMNEIRRQLAIAQEKLSASLSLAENDLLEGNVESPVLERELGDRFRFYDFCKTGIESIDEEHGGLIELGNRLYALSRTEEAGSEAIGEALAEMTTHAQKHFVAEERLMERHDYPKLEAHRATHRRMFEYLAEMYDLARETPLLISIRLEMFFGSWFIWHMQRDDAAFTEHMRSLEPR